MSNIIRTNTKKKKTKQDYENYLTDMKAPLEDMKSNGGRIPDMCEYGRWIRKHDPIAFNIGYNEFIAIKD